MYKSFFVFINYLFNLIFNLQNRFQSKPGQIAKEQSFRFLAHNPNEAIYFYSIFQFRYRLFLQHVKKNRWGKAFFTIQVTKTFTKFRNFSITPLSCKQFVEILIIENSCQSKLQNLFLFLTSHNVRSI